MVKPSRKPLKASLPSVSIPGAVVDDILAKKDLLVSKDFCRHIILRYLAKHPKTVTELGKEHFLKTRAYDELKKGVR